MSSKRLRVARRVEDVVALPAAGATRDATPWSRLVSGRGGDGWSLVEIWADSDAGADPCSGQLESSWWQKMTLSSTARETPVWHGRRRETVSVHSRGAWTLRPGSTSRGGAAPRRRHRPRPRQVQVQFSRRDRADHDRHRLVELAALVRVGRLGAVGLRRANHAVAQLLEGGVVFFASIAWTGRRPCVALRSS